MSTERPSKPLPLTFFGKLEANKRIKQFRSSKYALLSNALGKPDSKALSYTFKQIEDIYKELVYLNADGLRIYFSEYLADDPDFAGQLGVVLVPTYFNEDTNTSTDIILEDEPGFEKRPGSEFFADPDDAKAYNYGSPCPPVCPADGDLKYPFDNAGV